MPTVRILSDSQIDQMAHIMKPILAKGIEGSVQKASSMIKKEIIPEWWKSNRHESTIHTIAEQIHKIIGLSYIDSQPIRALRPIYSSYMMNMELVAIIEGHLLQILPNGRVHYLSDWSIADDLVQKGHLIKKQLDPDGSNEYFLNAAVLMGS